MAGELPQNLAEYQGDIFNILSLRAWNLWWLVQSLFAGGGFVADDARSSGRSRSGTSGYLVAGLLELVVARRDPARPAAADARRWGSRRRRSSPSAS